MSWITLDLSLENHYALINNSRKCVGARIHLLDDRVRLLYKVQTLQGVEPVGSLEEIYQVDALYENGISKRDSQGNQVFKYVLPANAELKYIKKGNMAPFDLTTGEQVEWAKNPDGSVQINPSYVSAKAEGQFFLDLVEQESLGEIKTWITQVFNNLKNKGRFNFPAP